MEAQSLSYLQITVLALVQGATEFIPVSSSGHLVLARELFAWSDDHGLVVDVMLHAASLMAVLIYFWRDWLAWWEAVRGRGDEERRPFYRALPAYLILATVPVILFAPGLKDRLESIRSAGIVAAIMVIVAVWFLIAERFKKTGKPFTWKTALAMGSIQVLALLPGASRSGLTTSMGMLMGQQRADAAKFAFFMLLPAISGAILIEVPDMAQAIHGGLDARVLLAGFVVCFAVSLACIHFCLKFFRTHSLILFSLYLFALGGTLLFTG